jgi:hypothetical protein
MTMMRSGNHRQREMAEVAAIWRGEFPLKKLAELPAATSASIGTYFAHGRHDLCNHYHRQHSTNERGKGELLVNYLFAFFGGSL